MYREVSMVLLFQLQLLWVYSGYIYSTYYSKFLDTESPALLLYLFDFYRPECVRSYDFSVAGTPTSSFLVIKLLKRFVLFYCRDSANSKLV